MVIVGGAPEGVSPRGVPSEAPISPRRKVRRRAVAERRVLLRRLYALEAWAQRLRSQETVQEDVLLRFLVELEELRIRCSRL